MHPAECCYTLSLAGKLWGKSAVEGTSGSIFYPITVTTTFIAQAINWNGDGAGFRQINVIGLRYNGINLENDVGSTTYLWLTVAR